VSPHLVARIGDERYAFMLASVVEALDGPALHDPPLRPDGMLGTLRHRGRTLEVWDGARVFGVRRSTGSGTALVIREGDRPLALVVDDALDIVEIAPDALRTPPAGTDTAGMLAGIARDARGVVSVVNVEALVTRLASWSARRAG
jgi:chemotaxis signal transduction protein